MTDNQGDELGKVRVLGADDEPPSSSLVDAFKNADKGPGDAIVLRGYLGRSDFFKRTREYLERAKRIEVEKAKDALVNNELPWEPSAQVESGPVEDLQSLIRTLDSVKAEAERHIPLRLYLTPSLDRYVDFHRSSLLAYRQEPKAERKDTYTVWLRIFDDEGQVPVPYRVIQETNIGPSFAGYIGGDLIDDYLEQSGSSGTAWGDQTSVIGGGKPRTGVYCGSKRTGLTCTE